jgi:hypothetical protein
MTTNGARGDGMVLNVEPCDEPIELTCLSCGVKALFFIGAIPAVYACGERIGFLGTCCLMPEAVKKLVAKAEEYRGNARTN